MESRKRSVRQDQASLAEAMRCNGCSWREVADQFVERWGLSYLQAFRLGHGWSQEEAARQYNTRWHPERPLTGKAISYWEMWPSKSGKEPPLSKLRKLAKVYECSLSDLVAERKDDHVGSSTASNGEALRRDVLKLGLLATASPDLVYRMLRDASSGAKPDLSPAIAELCALLMDYGFNVTR